MMIVDMRSDVRVVGAVLLATTLWVYPAEARKLHRHRPVPSSAAPTEQYARPPIPYAYSFYPHEIEGGVSGNLPFNNQIRKFRDPLNANGAGG